MDPLSALAVASAVVAFVDFGSKLLSRSRGIYRKATGDIRKEANLQQIANDLRDLGEAIQNELLTLQHLRPYSTTEDALALICRECVEAQQELTNAIDALQTVSIVKSKSGEIDCENPPTRENPLTKALLEIKFDVNFWKNWLDLFRERMTVAILSVLWKQSSLASKEIRQLTDQQTGIMQTLTEIQASTNTLNQTLIQYVQRTTIPEDHKRQTVINDIWFATSPPAPAAPTSDHRDETSFLNAIIQSLRFQGDTHREGAIPEAYEKTFQWIFAKPPRSNKNEPLWPDFIEWLESPSQEIYWITGKPGAGKSTLMKHLVAGPRTMEALGQWAKSRTLLLAGFYFWNAGTSLQKSQIGLFRSLLWQCLSGMPAIAPRVCPRRWALYKVFGFMAFDAAPEWTWSEIMESFSLMLPLIGDEFNLALFIDGLDEFEGAHEKLIDFLELFRAASGSKICISSRPWNVFLDSFRFNPGLRIEDLTNKDIQIFVEGRLKHKPNFEQLDKIYPEDAKKLIDGIVAKAQGVFLWVSVVVKALCEGLTEGDKLSDLQAELERLPSDLEDLYSSIWAGVKDKYKAHSSQLFQILECSTESLDAVTLWLADDSNVLQQDINEMDDEKREYIRQNMQRRLNSRTRGLLEVSRNGQVEYLHRSVHDWTIEMWPEIQTAAPRFDPHLALLKALTVEVSRKDIWVNSLLTLPNQFWEHTLVCMYHASQVRDDSKQLDSLIVALDRLDRDLSEISTAYPLHSGQLPLYRDTGSTSLLLSANSDLPHWASTQRTQTPDALKVNFLGLAAQFAILPYVRNKVLRNPKVLIPDWNEATIVECAIFGFRELCRPDIADLADHYIRSSVDTRLELTNFLLDHGGLPPAKPGPTGSRKRELREEIQQRASQKATFFATMSDAEPDEIRYWHNVVQRLDTLPEVRALPPLDKSFKSRKLVRLGSLLKQKWKLPS